MSGGDRFITGRAAPHHGQQAGLPPKAEAGFRTPWSAASGKDDHGTLSGEAERDAFAYFADASAMPSIIFPTSDAHG